MGLDLFAEKINKPEISTLTLLINKDEASLTKDLSCGALGDYNAIQMIDEFTYPEYIRNAEQFSKCSTKVKFEDNWYAIYETNELESWRKDWELFSIIQEVIGIEIGNCDRVFITAEDWDDIRIKTAEKIKELRNDIFYKGAYNVWDKYTLEDKNYDLHKLEDSIKKIPNEDCWFFPWW